MKISLDNYTIGNRATASVLLLYYHLLREGGFTNDQTIYVDSKDFNGFEFLDVVVEDSTLGIDQELLREGSIIYLLCDLNDVLAEYEEDFQVHELTKRTLSSLRQLHLVHYPEIRGVLSLFETCEKSFDFERFFGLLTQIYNKYVLKRFESLCNSGKLEQS